MNVKIVGGVEEAIEHINRYGSAHSDSIVTRNEATAMIYQVTNLVTGELNPAPEIVQMIAAQMGAQAAPAPA